MRILFLLILGVAVFALSGCTMKQVRNADLWYSISVPKTWTIKDGGLVSPNGDSLNIQRIRDDARINRLIKSTRNNVQRDMVGFVTESEDTNSIAGRCAWKLVGAHRPQKNGPELVIIRAIIDTNKPGTKDCEAAYEAGQYKYVITIQTPSESYNQRKLMINKIIKSFSFKIPAY